MNSVVAAGASYEFDMNSGEMFALKKSKLGGGALSSRGCRSFGITSSQIRWETAMQSSSWMLHKSN
jgi:hypothetical protein